MAKMSPSAAHMGISDSQLLMLERFDTVFLVDDSTSMAYPVLYKEDKFFSKVKSILRWDLAGVALQRFASIAARYDKDGIDVYFLNSDQYGQGLKTEEEISSLFESVRRSRGTPIGSKLNRILSPYLRQVKEGRLSGELPKPRNYIILTDGQPDDREQLVRLLTEVGRILNSCNCPKEQLGLQFVQIGDDQDATAFLESLDDGAKQFQRDFIDTVKHTPVTEPRGLRAKLRLGRHTREEDTMVRKLLLGGISRWHDAQ